MKQLPVEILAKLAVAGFVHITGMKVQRSLKDQESEVEARVRDLGRYDMNNGKTVLVTVDGQVWLGRGLLPEELIDELCPNGKGANVPCSNGESLEFNNLLYRMAYPY